MCKYHYIYKITNKVNQKFYIGRRSTDKQPDHDLYFGSGGKHFKNAIKKYGKENFTKEIIELCPNFEVLCEREIYYIDYFESYREEIGYNKIRVSEGWGVGELNPSFGNSENNPMFGKKGKDNPNTGLKRTPEHIEIIRKTHTGKIVSKKTRKLQSIAASKKTGDKNPFFEKSHTEESKQKIRHTQSKRPMLKCPHCDLESKSDANMKRYHFDNCKKKPGNEKLKFTRNVNIIKCPHCYKEGSSNLMSRYHFDNCKLKEVLVDG